MEYPNDAKRMVALLKELELTPYTLAKETGYKSESGMYNVKNGVRRISPKMARAIVTKFRHISLNYLLGKTDKILVSEKAKMNQQNILHAFNSKEKQQSIDLLHAIYEETLHVKSQNEEILELLRTK